MPALDGGERPEGAHHARQVVGNGRRPRRHRRPIGIARDVADAAHRARDAAEARPLPARARLPERGDAHHHEPWVHAGQLVIAEMPLLHGAGTEVLREDVGLGGQARDQRLAFGRAQVARDRFLVPGLDQPHVRHAVGGLVSEPAEVVADPRLLDLDHLRAVLAEERAAEGRGDERRQVQRHEAVESSAHLVSNRPTIAQMLSMARSVSE